jgi:hypothetical protein
MSTRHFRSIHDFARFRMDVEVTCYCEHKAVLPVRQVVAAFHRNRWPIGLGSALGRFRCTKCGSSAKWIGPLPRD